MSDELEEATSFAVLRPLIISTLKDLKQESKDQQVEINDLKTKYALLNQKVAMYATGAAVAGSIAVQVAKELLCISVDCLHQKDSARQERNLGVCRGASYRTDIQSYSRCTTKVCGSGGEASTEIC